MNQARRVFAWAWSSIVLLGNNPEIETWMQIGDLQTDMREEENGAKRLQKKKYFIAVGGWEAAREAAPKGQHAVYHSLTHTVELFKGFSRGFGLPCISIQACLGNSWRPQSQSCMLAVKLEETLSPRGTLQPGTLESMSLASTLYDLRVT